MDPGVIHALLQVLSRSGSDWEYTEHKGVKYHWRIEDGTLIWRDDPPEDVKEYTRNELEEHGYL